ncbi:hypothetical protein DPMN_046001 [Dreissena polymorpha]|uniref:Uncharacterized protein n=1 Tax=Dreissena polymorpha TaxID=45954 RepID=A0A9D4D708_DREPO|nr:hypothetical protein DPMN_046001 [Dreissena polymorpha]
MRTIAVTQTSPYSWWDRPDMEKAPLETAFWARRLSCLSYRLDPSQAQSNERLLYGMGVE